MPNEINTVPAANENIQAHLNIKNHTEELLVFIGTFQAYQDEHSRLTKKKLNPLIIGACAQIDYEITDKIFMQNKSGKIPRINKRISSLNNPIYEPAKLNQFAKLILENLHKSFIQFKDAFFHTFMRLYRHNKRILVVLLSLYGRKAGELNFKDTKYKIDSYIKTLESDIGKEYHNLGNPNLNSTISEMIVLARMLGNQQTKSSTISRQSLLTLEGMCTTFITQSTEVQPHYGVLNNYSNLAQLEQGIVRIQLQNSANEKQLQSCYDEIKSYSTKYSELFTPTLRVLEQDFSRLTDEIEKQHQMEHQWYFSKKYGMLPRHYFILRYQMPYNLYFVLWLLQRCHLLTLLDVYILRQIINTILYYEKDVTFKDKDSKHIPVLYLPLRNQQLFNRINDRLSQFVLERHLYDL